MAVRTWSMFWIWSALMGTAGGGATAPARPRTEAGMAMIIAATAAMPALPAIRPRRVRRNEPSELVTRTPPAAMWGADRPSWHRGGEAAEPATGLRRRGPSPDP